MAQATRTRKPAPAPAEDERVPLVKDFDPQRHARQEEPEDARRFRIGGERFVHVATVRPEALFEFENIGDDTGVSETFEIIDQTILAMIENGDGSHERYRALRARDTDPLSIIDLRELVEWLVGRMTDRTPTRPPSRSSRGPESSEAS